MAFDKGDIRALIEANLGSQGTPDRTGGIQTPDVDRLIDDAVVYYSRLHPNEAIKDYPGDAATFDFALPSDWSTTFSIILSAEYPKGNRVPTFLDLLEVQIYQDTAGEVIRLLSTTPASNETLRILYTRPHVVDPESSNTTVSEADKEAIGHLATHFAATRLAAEMAKTVPSALRDDPLQLRSSVGEYERIARRHWRLFADHMGIDENSRVPPSAREVTYTNRMSWGRKPNTHANIDRIFRR